MRLFRRYLSLDDLWSLVGYALIVGVNQLTRRPMELPMISVLASGMLAIAWMASAGLRARNAEKGPNARVAFWAVVSVISVLFAAG